MAKIFTALTLFTEYEILSYETVRRFQLQLDPSIKAPGTEKKKKNQHFTFHGLEKCSLTTERGELTAQSSVSWCDLQLKNK